MKSRSVLLGAVILLVVVATVVSACGGGAPEEPAVEEPAEASVSVDGETLLQERCTECHGLDRTTSAQKTRDEWESTVSRMVSKGAELSDEEKTVLVDYLAETYGP